MMMASLFSISVIIVLCSAVASSHVVGDVNKELMDQVLKRVQALEDRNQVLEDAVTDVRDKRFLEDITEGPIAFTARVDERKMEHLNANDNVVFHSELLDIGNGYDNQTGIFTAPLSGLYMFSCSMLDHMAGPNGDTSLIKIHAEIMQGQTVLARVFAHAEQRYRDQGAQTIIAQVQKGDQIYVRLTDNDDVTVGGDMYSTFSGYMLYQM